MAPRHLHCWAPCSPQLLAPFSSLSGSPSHLTRRDTRRAGAGDTGDEADGRAATARYLRGRANTELGRFELAKEGKVMFIVNVHQRVAQDIKLQKVVWEALQDKVTKKEGLPDILVILEP